MKTSLILLLACFTSSVRAAIVTLTAQAQDGTNGIAELTVGQYEVAEVVSFPAYMNSSGAIYVVKDGKTLTHVVRNSDNPKYFDPLIVAGPATLRLIAQASFGGPMLCTVRITPEAYPPDRAILVPPGTNQARITLECSTNLVQWFSATNGVYGPLPEAKFFRIKMEPVP